MMYYLKITIRNFLRHKVSSIINLVGLTTGLVCTLFIYLWVQDELRVDAFHEKDDRLYKVMELQSYSDFISATSSTPGILGENIKIDFADIKYSATTTWVEDHLLSYSDKFFKEEGFHVGEDFFNIFSYPLLHGNPDNAIKDKTSISISKSLALKIFGNTDAAMGKSLRYDEDRSFTVQGVFEDIPDNSTYQFDFVLPFEDYKDDNEWVLSWGNNGPRTFVILNEGANAENVSESIKGYVKSKNPDDSNVELFLKKYSEAYLYGSYSNGVSDGGRIEYVRLFSAIALFILIIACINFMNLSTARASKRAHEVGVRKAIGARRKVLVWQFIGESILISLVSLILAGLILTVLLPQFNLITDKKIILEFTPTLISVAIGIVLLTGFLAGSYPALYLTSFNPVSVLKGDIKTSMGELWARKGLVVFQFTLTIILIIGVLVIYKQTRFIFTKNLGYDQDNIVLFEQTDKMYDNPETFMEEMKKIPGVVNAGGVGHDLLGRNNNTSGLDWKGKNPEERILFENIRVSYGLMETMGFSFSEGRSFSKEFGADSTKIIINQAAAKVMGMEKAVGQNIMLWEEYDLEIIGVIEDFHFQSFKEEVAPAFFTLNGTWNLAVRLKAGQEAEAMLAIQDFYEEYNPGFIFDYQFLDKGYEELYTSELRIGTLSKYFAGFAILISCLGLFGLASFTAERRIKEIGIRKVLGASVTNIVMMLSKDFTRLVGISIILAVPISWYLMSRWLSNFAYKINLGASLFIGAAVISLLIAWLTVSSQALRAAQINPSKCLKDE